MTKSNPYHSGSDVIIIVIEDCSGRKNGKYRIGLNNTTAIKKAFTEIIDKYGIPLEVVGLEKKPYEWLKADEQFRF